MRKTLPLLAVLILFFLPQTTNGQTIVGSLHDFSSAGWNSSGEICVVCHAPHNAVQTDPGGDPVFGAPLWNHEITNATFTLYSSPTLHPSYPPQQPRGNSKLCLSCHDGTIALDSFGNMSGSTFMTGAKVIGTDLSDDHPVSIEWKHQTGPPMSNEHCMHCHFMANEDRLLPFYSGYVECSTCHDVHNTSGEDKLLRMTMQGSLLCLFCHDK